MVVLLWLASMAIGATPACPGSAGMVVTDELLYEDPCALTVRDDGVYLDGEPLVTDAIAQDRAEATLAARRDRPRQPGTMGVAWVDALLPAMRGGGEAQLRAVIEAWPDVERVRFATPGEGYGAVGHAEMWVKFTAVSAEHLVMLPTLEALERPPGVIPMRERAAARSVDALNEALVAGSVVYVGQTGGGACFTIGLADVVVDWRERVGAGAAVEVAVAALRDDVREGPVAGPCAIRNVADGTLERLLDLESAR